MMTTTRPRRLRRLKVLSVRDLKESSGRFSGAIFDQVLSSLTNFALGLIVARTLGPTEFGAFSLAFATYLVVLGVSRSLNTDALLIRFSACSAEEWRSGTAAATGSAISLGAIAGLLAVGFGAAIGGVTGTSLVAMGIAMPGLMLQDAWRMAFFTAGRPSRAVVNDLIWVVVMSAALAVLFATGHTTLFPLTLAWGGAATVATLVGFIQAKIGVPRLNPVPWWHAHRDLGPRFLAEFAATGMLTAFTMYAIGFLAGLHAVGAIRAAQLILGPFTILLQGGTAFGVAESARMLKRSRADLYRASNTFSVALGAAATLWGVFALMLPDAKGAAILGASWAAGRSVLVPTIVYMAASGIGIGANVGLRAFGAARESLNTKLVLGLSIFVAGVVGAASGGLQGAAWGIAVANVVGVWLRWWVYRRVLFEDRPYVRPRSSLQKRSDARITPLTWRPCARVVIRHVHVRSLTKSTPKRLTSPSLEPPSSRSHLR